MDQNNLMWKTLDSFNSDEGLETHDLQQLVYTSTEHPHCKTFRIITTSHEFYDGGSDEGAYYSFKSDAEEDFAELKEECGI